MTIRYSLMILLGLLKCSRCSKLWSMLPGAQKASQMERWILSQIERLCGDSPSDGPKGKELTLQNAMS